MLTQIELKPVSRRALFSVLPGCLGCARAMARAQTGPAHTWTEKADLTWEEIFRFAYQKDLIPLLKQMGEMVGREKFVTLLREASDEVVRKKSARRPQRAGIDLAALAANIKKMPPLMQHALEGEITEESPEVFAYRVKKCLWAKAYREGDAADIGYAMICYPDYAVARSLNPKLRLTRDKTLMQGADHCYLRYTMES
jgi:predicted RNA-binding protein YlxR (DUF448 family)